MRRAGDVGRAEVELGAVAVEERRVAASLVLGKDVDLGLEVGVRGDRARLGEHLAALDVFLVDPAQQHAHVVAGLHLVEQLAEHLEVGRDGLAGVVDPDDLDLTHLGELALLDLAGDDRAAPGDREHVLDRHQERLLGVTHRLGDVGITRLHQLVDLGHPRLVALQGLQGRYLHDRGVVAGELVGGEQLADLELDELKELGVIHRVALVQAPRRCRGRRPDGPKGRAHASGAWGRRPPRPRGSRRRSGRRR